MTDEEHSTSFNLWNDLGFTSNPYSTDSIKPTPESRRYFVGREKELKRALRLLTSGQQAVTIEGDFGIGKTSLASVIQVDAAALASEGGPLFLPATRSLGLDGDSTTASFRRAATSIIAETFVVHRAQLHERGYRLAGIKHVARRLNAPEFGSRSFGLGSFFANFAWGAARSPNPTEHYLDFGLPATVQKWLNETFPEPDSGGVICLIDNLESVADPKRVKKIVEDLRDEFFAHTGLRWIISGAEGLVRTTFSTPKMSGNFAQPIELTPIGDRVLGEALNRRIELLRVSPDVTAPVSVSAFRVAYGLSGRNLRFALNLAKSFCQDVLADDPSGAGVDQEFFNYLIAEASDIASYANAKVSPADRAVFERLMDGFRGTCSPSDFTGFGYRGQSQFIKRIQSLRRHNVVEYRVHDEDLRRRVVTVSSNGRLWNLHRALTQD